jgi:hypothetical protein
VLHLPGTRLDAAQWCALSDALQALEELEELQLEALELPLQQKGGSSVKHITVTELCLQRPPQREQQGQQEEDAGPAWPPSLASSLPCLESLVVDAMWCPGGGCLRGLPLGVLAQALRNHPELSCLQAGGGCGGRVGGNWLCAAA